MTLKSQT